MKRLKNMFFWLIVLAIFLVISGFFSTISFFSYQIRNLEIMDQLVFGQTENIEQASPRSLLNKKDFSVLAKNSFNSQTEIEGKTKILIYFFTRFGEETQYELYFSSSGKIISLERKHSIFKDLLYKEKIKTDNIVCSFDERGVVKALKREMKQ